MTHRLLVYGGILVTALAAGCNAPTVQPAPPERLEQGQLAFLQPGKTTRENVLLHLGTPMAQFEGERILTYAFNRDAQGQWQRVGRWSANGQGRFDYAPGTCSLVLVFGPDGVLLRQSLILSQ